jgi:hypothetical protein
MVLEDARAYVAAARWQQCRRPVGGPHQYTHLDWSDDLRADWHRFRRFINSAGVQRPWPKPPAKAVYRMRYLLLDGYVYFGPAPRDLLNRQTLADARVQLGDDFLR